MKLGNRQPFPGRFDAVQCARGADSVHAGWCRRYCLDCDVCRDCESGSRSFSLPVLIQDFNPGGATVGADFAARLVQAADNFRYLKLEEPMMGAKVRAIRAATGGQVGVFEGWGGMYLLALIGDGICGAIPGLAVCDWFTRVFP